MLLLRYVCHMFLTLHGPSLGELVHDGQNGFVFENAENLAKLLTVRLYV
jgi:hypothetical protein